MTPPPPHASPAARVTKEIHLDRVRRNTARIRSLIGAGVRVLAVVKADAYGHGAVQAARAALAGGASRLCVCDVREAQALRQAGVQAPIHALGALFPDEVDQAVRLRVVPSVHEPAEVPRLVTAARRHGVRVPVHVAIDTGMGRFGAAPEAGAALALRVAAEPALKLEGLMTHLACADDPDPAFSAGQIERFRRVTEALSARGSLPPLVHAAASAGLARFPAARFSAVRPGLALYGVEPRGEPLPGLALEPALALRSRIALVKDVAAGATLSYGASYRAPAATRVAVVACGYHDGYPLLPRGHEPFEVLVRGQRCRVLGRVTMDYLLADVGGIPGAAVATGERVTLIGRDGDEEVRVEELARRAGTIPYEVLVRIGPRVRTVWLGERRALRRAAAPAPMRRGTARSPRPADHPPASPAAGRRPPRADASDLASR